MTASLFDKYGGVPAVTLIVREFHERLMRRPNLRRYFEEMEMDKVSLPPESGSHNEMHNLVCGRISDEKDKVALHVGI